MLVARYPCMDTKSKAKRPAKKKQSTVGASII